MQRGTASLPEHDDHRAVMILEDSSCGLRAVVAIHRGGIRYPSFGATRMARYPSFREAVRDALRLSRGMSYKSAMAGLPFGGAKAVIDWDASSRVPRTALITAYARRLAYLQDRFVTGTDVGLQNGDIRMMRRFTKNVVGHSVDPSRWTAVGIVHAMEAAAKARWGSADLAGRTVAIQGVGKVGGVLVQLLHRRGARLTISDTDRTRVAHITSRYPGTVGTSPQRILRAQVDILAPCALFSVLNERSVPALNCELIVGGANNQLASSDAGDAIHRRGIWYIPDYVANAGGLISVTQEYVRTGRPTASQLTDAVAQVGTITAKVLRQSARQRSPIHRVADQVARERVRAFT